MVIQRDSSDSEDERKVKRARMENVESSPETSPMEENALEESPMEENASEGSPLEENASEESPLEENASEESPLEENASEESPLEENAAEESALELSPTEESPLEVSPTEESPLEESSPNDGSDEIPSSWLDEDTDYRILEDHSIYRVHLPSKEKDKDVRLECDDSAYDCHHRVVTINPCLTFDVVPDELGFNRADKYPLTMTVIGGTHRISFGRNNLFVLKLSNMHKNDDENEKNEENKENEGNKDNEEESDSGSENNAFKPALDTTNILHPGRVNRIKVTKFSGKALAATWSGGIKKVYIWDLSRAIAAVHDPYFMAAHALENYDDKKNSPPPYSFVFSFTGHSFNGYALQWSHLTHGMLASGDYSGSVYVYKLIGGTWHADSKPFKANTESVQDIQWSPKETNVMMTCSDDKSIRVWDIRAAPEKACMLTKQDAHDAAVTAISWNPQGPLILSGGQEGLIKIWDLRKFSGGEAISSFKHHKSIISLEWHPTRRSVFAASGKDDQVTQWDLAAERNKETDEKDSSELLPQLLFVHRGQDEVGEIHWHKQMPGVLISTAMNGWNIIRTFKI